MPSKNPSTESNSAFATQSWLSVARAYNLCDAVLTQRLAALGLRVGEHEVLLNLLRTPGLTQQQLAQRCFVAKSGVSMLVTRMEQADLMLREADPLDARSKRLALTPQGQVLAKQAQAVQAEVVAAMVQHSSPQELATIAAAMQRVSATLEAMLRVDAAQRRSEARQSSR